MDLQVVVLGAHVVRFRGRVSFHVPRRRELSYQLPARGHSEEVTSLLLRPVATVPLVRGGVGLGRARLPEGLPGRPGPTCREVCSEAGLVRGERERQVVNGLAPRGPAAAAAAAAQDERPPRSSSPVSDR